LLALDERSLFFGRIWVGIVPTVTHGAAIASLAGTNGSRAMDHLVAKIVLEEAAQATPLLLPLQVIHNSSVENVTEYSTHKINSICTCKFTVLAMLPALYVVYKSFVREQMPYNM
jgi:hypothetical protein